MITIVSGNLLEATEDIIGHQVNCQGVMGSGIAKQIREKYPVVYDAYMTVCRVNRGSGLLGTCLIVECGEAIVANLFGQNNYGREKRLYTNYIALEIALRDLKLHSKRYGLSVALPYGIGCGLANGDWDGVVYRMLEDVFSDYQLTLYKYEG